MDMGDIFYGMGLGNEMAQDEIVDDEISTDSLEDVYNEICAEAYDPPIEKVRINQIDGINRKKPFESFVDDYITKINSGLI